MISRFVLILFIMLSWIQASEPRVTRVYQPLQIDHAYRDGTMSQVGIYQLPYLTRYSETDYSSVSSANSLSEYTNRPRSDASPNVNIASMYGIVLKGGEFAVTVDITKLKKPSHGILSADDAVLITLDCLLRMGAGATEEEIKKGRVAIKIVAKNGQKWSKLQKQLNQGSLSKPLYVAKKTKLDPAMTSEYYHWIYQQTVEAYSEGGATIIKVPFLAGKGNGETPISGITLRNSYSDLSNFSRNDGLSNVNAYRHFRVFRNAKKIRLFLDYWPPKGSKEALINEQKKIQVCGLLDLIRKTLKGEKDTVISIHKHSDYPLDWKEIELRWSKHDMNLPFVFKNN